MDWRGWTYFIFTMALFVVFVFIVLRYYRTDRKHKEEVEKPKLKMLDDDDVDRE